MVRSEFMSVGGDVFSEFMPKVKASEARELLEAFLVELQDRGVDIEDDEAEDFYERED